MPRSMDPLVVGRVVGDVVDPYTSSVSLRIVYNNSSEVTNSCQFKPSQVINQPRVDVGGDDFRTFYTLVYMLNALSCVSSFLSLENFSSL